MAWCQGWTHPLRCSQAGGGGALLRMRAASGPGSALILRVTRRASVLPEPQPPRPPTYDLLHVAGGAGLEDAYACKCLCSFKTRSSAQKLFQWGTQRDSVLGEVPQHVPPLCQDSHRGSRPRGRGLSPH